VPRIAEKVKSLPMLLADFVTLSLPEYRSAGFYSSHSGADTNPLLYVDSNPSCLSLER
jgi:hypothetical protein